MANTSAAKKEVRASARRAVRNRSAKSAVKTSIAKVRRASTSDGVEALTDLATAAISSLDRAAAKGIVHANNAARRKSRIAKRVNLAVKGEVHVEPVKGTRKGAAATKASEKGSKAAPAKKPATRAKKSS